MKMIEMNWRPDERTLRQFGLLSLLFSPLLGWTTAGHPLTEGWDDRAVSILLGFVAIGAMLALAGWLSPKMLRPVFIGLCLAMLPIGMVVGEVLVMVIFFGIFTPVALLFRLLKRDALDRRFEPARKSYWRPKSQPADVRRYFRQY